jgi:hypothetical protein
MSSSRIRYTILYGNRATRSCRFGNRPVLAMPISGCARIKSTVRTTVSWKSPPRPDRRISYQRTASASSSDAGWANWTSFTAQGCLSQFVVSRAPMVRAASRQPQSPQCDVRSLRPRRVRRRGRPAPRDSQGVLQRAPLAPRRRDGARQPTRRTSASPWLDLMPRPGSSQDGSWRSHDSSEFARGSRGIRLIVRGCRRARSWRRFGEWRVGLVPVLLHRLSSVTVTARHLLSVGLGDLADELGPAHVHFRLAPHDLPSHSP